MTILQMSAVCDGWDVRIITAGQAVTLHFAAEPTQAQIEEAGGEFETRMTDQLVTTYELNNEESDDALHEE